MPTPPSRHVRWPLTLAIAVALSVTAVTWPVAQTPATAAELYSRAQALEQAARAGDAPSARAMRDAATAYERVVRQFPGSGYADNALWQSARLLGDAFAASGSAADVKKAEKWLRWLRDEYPASTYAKQVDAALDALSRPAPAAAEARTSSAAAAPSAPPPSAQPSAPLRTGRPAEIRSITATPLPRGQRIAIELSQEVAFRGEQVDGPDRVYLDFTNTTVSAAIIERARSLAGGLIKGTRFGHPSDGVTRVVLDLSGRHSASFFPYYDPFRVLIDVVDANAPVEPTKAERGHPVSSVKPAAPVTAPSTSSTTAPPAATSTIVASAASPSSPPKTPTPRPSPPARDDRAPVAGTAPTPNSTPPASLTRDGAYTLGRQLGLGISRIVIDAGHGGHDPGAKANGVTEAELVLDVARRLEILLDEVGGFQVVLTRTSDDYVALEERTAIANRHDADLFLSIHANASRDTSARGVETYFLNLATNKAAEAVAARENALTAQGMGTLPDLLKAIANNNKATESREFATFVQASLKDNLSQQNRALRDLGVKQAPFVVLIGARMPSVLAEISFLTNKKEATLLKQSSFRQKIAQGLCDAVVKYQASLKKVATVASKDSER
jgi:N-acetylmuramoyl-L-alanine amidase